MPIFKKHELNNKASLGNTGLEHTKFLSVVYCIELRNCVRFNFDNSVAMSHCVCHNSEGSIDFMILKNSVLKIIG